ncbi:MAG TPA: hypothetical protein VFS86_01765, partial [Rhodanobacteraceae bacterium]|nr:hypothetical protein [Rhodanobacteraceae bacterium]
ANVASGSILLKNSRRACGDEKSTNSQQKLGNESSTRRSWRPKLHRNRVLAADVLSAKFSSRVFQQNRSEAVITAFSAG